MVAAALIFLVPQLRQARAFQVPVRQRERCHNSCPKTMPCYGENFRRLHQHRDVASHSDRRKNQQHPTRQPTMLAAAAAAMVDGSLSHESFTTMIRGVPVFDGSTITDPMVVSSAYWTNLQAQLGWYMLLQLVSIAIFAIAASITVQQAPMIVDGTLWAIGLGPRAEKSRTRPPLKVPPPMNGGEATAGRRGPPPRMDAGALGICVALDFLGSASDAIPVFGSAADVVYAPLAAVVLRAVFGGSNVAFVVELAEEILPFTDVLPFCTICWVIHTFSPRSDLARVLQLGEYTPRRRKQQ